MTTSPGPWLADTMHGLPCRVLLPEPYEPDARRYPLVLALHGSMERGDDNVSQLRNEFKGKESKDALMFAAFVVKEA